MAIYRMFLEVVSRLADLVQYNYDSYTKKKERRKRKDEEFRLLSFFIFFEKHR